MISRYKEEEGAGGFQSGHSALFRQVPLELGHAGEDGEEEFALGCCRVQPGFAEGLNVGSDAMNLVDDFEEVLCGAGKHPEKYDC